MSVLEKDLYKEPLIFAVNINQPLSIQTLVTRPFKPVGTYIRHTETLTHQNIMPTPFISDFIARARPQQSSTQNIDLSDLLHRGGGYAGFVDEIWNFYAERRQKVTEEGQRLQNPQSEIDKAYDELQEQRNYDLEKFLQATKIVELYESGKQRIRKLGEQRRVKQIHVDRSLNILQEELDSEVMKFFVDY